ncbi:MAG: glycosyltransferase family 9 protein [Bacteroidaceae bacterium]|nr:glycosyltransferase family 9 protein [Bacteroidaceae bacterium]
MVQKSNKEQKRILITRFSAVGDIAMTIPLLYSLCRQYPQHRFFFVSRERFGQFFINHPENLEFIGVKPENYGGLWGLYKLYKKLRAYKPDIIADLHDVLRTKILRTYFKLLSGANCFHIIKGRKEKKALTRQNNKCRTALTSTFERYRDVFTRAGMPFTPDFVSLFGCDAGDITEFASFVPAKGNDKWVGIAPFARHDGKIYPIEKMEETVSILSEQKNIRLFFFGNGPKEEAVINGWCSKYPNCISFINRSNFNGELRLISHLDAMVCMDSANMHMASLVNTPAISIWGATSPLAGFLGWRQKEEDCIQLPLECRPCSIFGNKPCLYGDCRCMNIPPSHVAERIIKRIAL